MKRYWRALLLVLLLAPLGAQALLGFKSLGYSEMLAAELPPEGRQILALIKQGGPYPYAKDGSTFGNREGLLPKKPRGYYKEYTVPTPGSRDRGARRIVAGEARDYWYSNDHYRSFRRIRE